MSSFRPEDIVCFEVGSAHAPAWLGSQRELGADWSALETHAQRGVIRIEACGDRVSIRGTTRTGLVILPSGRRLVLRSKVPSHTLLEWLAFLGDFPRLTSWLREAGVSPGAAWHECLGSLFLNALDDVTRHHLKKDYVAVVANTAEIRGRILATRLARQFHHLPRVPQNQRRRSHDTLYNIVLARALDRCVKLLNERHPEDLRRFSLLHEQWRSIDRSLDDPAAAVHLAQWASPPGYRTALQLAQLILLGAALDPVSNMGGQAFTLSLSHIWERALRRLFDQLAESTGWQRVADDRRTRRWDDLTENSDAKRWLTADVIVERAGQRWVLDAKYKRDFGEESRTDRFQVCAYALAFDADRASLVYPTASPTVPVRRLLSTTVFGKRIEIDSLALPFAAGPERCCAALADIAVRDKA